MDSSLGGARDAHVAPEAQATEKTSHILRTQKKLTPTSNWTSTDDHTSRASQGREVRRELQISPPSQNRCSAHKLIFTVPRIVLFIVVIAPTPLMHTKDFEVNLIEHHA